MRGQLDFEYHWNVPLELQGQLRTLANGFTQSPDGLKVQSIPINSRSA